MNTNVIYAPPPEEFEPPPKPQKGRLERLVLGIVILFFVLSILLVLDMMTKWMEYGFRIETAIIVAAQIVIGVSLTRQHLYRYISKRLQLADIWQKLGVSIGFFLLMLMLTLFVLPGFATIIYHSGEKELADPQGNRTLGRSDLNLSLQLQPGPLVSSIPFLLRVNPNYPSASAAHFTLGISEEDTDYGKAEYHYLRSLELNECHLFSYWRLGQLRVVQKNFGSAHTILGNGIHILEGQTRPHCQTFIENFDKEELHYWLYLTEARAYILEKKYDFALDNLNIVQSEFANYQAIQEYQFITYYYWLIKVGEGLEDCSIIQTAWQEMQPHRLNLPAFQTNPHIIRERIEEAERIQAAC